MALSGPAAADVVVLNNGGRFVGVLMASDDGHVTIRSEGTEWTFARAKVKSVEREEPGRVREQAHKARLDKEVAKPRLVVYGTSWCSWCRKAREYLRSRNIAFEDKDVEADPGAKAEMENKKRAAKLEQAGVPFIDAYGTLISGFDVAALDRAIARRGKE